MAALTRLGCFILCPHLSGDCDLTRPILSMFRPLLPAELCTGRSESSKMRCKPPNGQWLVCAEKPTSGARSADSGFDPKADPQPLPWEPLLLVCTIKGERDWPLPRRG